MLDFLEHFPYTRTEQILRECYRILRDDGTVVIQVPDAQIIGAVLCGRGAYQCNGCGGWMRGHSDERWTEKCPKCGRDEDVVFDAAMMRMFGGQDHPGNFHQTCFTTDSLARLARGCGLFWQRNEEEEHQAANWNFKSIFTKGDPWR